MVHHSRSMIASSLASLAVISVAEVFSQLTRHLTALSSGYFTPCRGPVSQAMKHGAAIRGDTAVLQRGLPAPTIRRWGLSIGGPAIPAPCSTRTAGWA